MGGDPQAVDALIDALLPIVQKRVVRVLWRKSKRPSLEIRRQDIEDLMQDVLASLFANNGRVLRAWCPDGSLSFANFVGMVTERQVVSILRIRKRNPWVEHATHHTELEALVGTTTPEQDGDLANKDLLRTLLGELRTRLDPTRWRLFELLFLDERTIEEVAVETGLTEAAVYKRRTRLRNVARELAAQLVQER